MKFAFKKASTSLILTVFIQDSSSTTGAGLGSLDQTSSIVGGYVRMGSTGVALAVDENVTTEGTYEAPTTAAQVRIGTPANMRTGTYELHFHNDLFATGADTVTITLGGATNMADLPIEIQLTNFDFNDASPLVTLANETHTGAVIPTVTTLTGHTAQTADHTAGIAAIPTTAMRGTDSSALATVCTEGRLAELDAGNLPNDIAAIDTATMRGTDNAALASVLGALADSAHTGDPSATDTVMQYAKQLVNVLVGSAGVAAFPAEASPGNAVSLAEVLRAVHADVTGLAGAAMRGTDSAALATALTTAQADLDTITGSDGVTLATTQANYAPSTAAALASLVTTVGVAGLGLSAVPKTGYKLASDGIDLVLVDGKTLPAALQIIGAVVAGKISGAGEGTEIFVGLDNSTTRVTVTVDGSGNRSAVVYG